MKTWVPVVIFLVLILNQQPANAVKFETSIFADAEDLQDAGNYMEDSEKKNVELSFEDNLDDRKSEPSPYNKLPQFKSKRDVRDGAPWDEEIDSHNDDSEKKRVGVSFEGNIDDRKKEPNLYNEYGVQDSEEKNIHPSFENNLDDRINEANPYQEYDFPRFKSKRDVSDGVPCDVGGDAQCDRASPSLDNDPQPRIIGGADAFPEQFPWHAFVTQPGTRKTCGGALIEGEYVLTAAHCVNRNARPDAHKVLLGTTSYHRGQSYSVKYMTVHPDFNSDKVDTPDIAILRIHPKAEISSRIQTIEWAAHAPEDGQLCTISGYGIRDEINVNGDNTRKSLRHTYLPFMKDCEDVYADSMQGTNKYVSCFGFRSSNSDGVCSGDSGSPIICYRYGQYRLYGIVSKTIGYLHGICGNPAIGVDIMKNKDWLNLELLKLKAKPV